MAQDKERELDDIGDGATPPKPNAKQNVKKELEKTPVKMILMIFGVMIVVMFLFIKIRAANRAEQEKPVSQVMAAPGGVNTTPGQEGTSPRYERLVEGANDQRSQEALQTGGSAIHSITNERPQTVAMAQVQEQPKLPPVPQQQQVQPTEQGAPQGGDGGNNRASGQIKTLFETWQPGTQRVALAKVNEGTKAAATAGTQPAATASAAGTAAAPAADANQEVTTVFYPGDLALAETTLLIDSDVPNNIARGVVLAGPHAGGVLMGNWAVGKDTVSVTFNTLKSPLYKQPLQISAMAIDYKIYRAALEGEIDKHYLLRYGTMLATSFISGFADAVARGNSTTTVGINGVSTVYGELSPKDRMAVAVGKAADNFASSFSGVINRPDTFTIPAHTEFGLLFTSQVDVAVKK